MDTRRTSLMRRLLGCLPCRKRKIMRNREVESLCDGQRGYILSCETEKRAYQFLFPCPEPGHHDIGCTVIINRINGDVEYSYYRDPKMVILRNVQRKYCQKLQERDIQQFLVNLEFKIASPLALMKKLEMNFKYKENRFPVRQVVDIQPMSTMPGLNEYEYDGKELLVTDAMKEDFNRDGFIVVRNMLSRQELDIIMEAIEGENSLTTYAYSTIDGQGRMARRCIWNKVGKDTTGAVSSTRKMAGTASKLLGVDVYHYHSKVMMKDAKTGGRFHWHQDYGYWYTYGCIFPDMLSIFTAIDRCDTGNGCLQVMRGSHRCGRINHGVLPGGDQVGPDPERLELLDKRFETIPVELNPGDSLIFHCNLFHRSNRNDSERRRWCLCTAYCRTDNASTLVHGTEVPLEILDNDVVIKRGVSRDLTGKDVIVKHPGEQTFTHHFE